MTEGSGIDAGTPGGSARREHERRRARRETNTQARHPRIGKLLLRAQSAPASETAWETGAAGEEMLAAHLAKTCPDLFVLHDRRVPGRRTNIDHLAVAASGVFVIDAKRYKGKIEVRKPFFGDASLFIAGRNRTKLVEGLARQQEVVRSVLAEAIPEMPVHACFCFLNPTGQAGGSGVPLVRTLSINGFPLFYPRKLSKRLNTPGALSTDSRREVAEPHPYPNSLHCRHARRKVGGFCESAGERSSYAGASGRRDPGRALQLAGEAVLNLKGKTEVVGPIDVADHDGLSAVVAQIEKGLHT